MASASARRSRVDASPVIASGLDVDGLDKRFGGVVALDGCSFAARRGACSACRARTAPARRPRCAASSGSSAGPRRGALAGAALDRNVRLRFGYLPEERGLYPHMRVRTQLQYLARLSGLERRRAAAAVERWLARLGLGERGDTPLDALSHGNQQRVQLAAAVVHDPVAVVLDEPFAGLDPIGVDALRP